MDWSKLNSLEKLLILNLLPYVRKSMVSKTKLNIEEIEDKIAEQKLLADSALKKLKKNNIDVSGQSAFDVNEQATIINWIYRSFSDYYWYLATIFCFYDQYLDTNPKDEVFALVANILHQTRSVLDKIGLDSDIPFTPMFGELTRLKYEYYSRTVVPDFQKAIEIGLIYFQDFYLIDVYNSKGQ
jgi:hypothetical protein